jgi:uncharacterized lipoprotein YddW (UPF0748 family)
MLSAHADPAGTSPVRQFRALWLASVVNIDWPSETGLPAKQQRDEYVAWLDLAKDLGLNAVISQVRPTADAFWKSHFEPWSVYLTGTQGKSPGYDPLKFQIEEAHKRGLEYHAWFNPYRVAMTEDASTLIDSHPARKNPDWVFPYGGKLYFDPGIPEVTDHVLDSMLDAVLRYDVDGAHFDDYFYPYPVDGEEVPDQETFETYSDGTQSIEDWRRSNINDLVRRMHERIQAKKPWVKFGISPFGIWRNAANEPNGSDTTGSESYEIISADSRTWVKEGWVDYINPQIYWEFGNPAADYQVLARWWADTVKDTDVALYIGEAAYKAVDGTFTDVDELSKHLDLDAELDEVDGNVYFSAVSLRDDTTGSVAQLVADHYQYPALVPVIDHLKGKAPKAPTILRVTKETDGVHIRWKSPGATNVAVWYLPGGTSVKSALKDPFNLVTVLRAEKGTQRTFHLGADGTGSYVVTAYDRTWRQSEPSRPRSPR